MAPSEMANYEKGVLHLKETVFGVWSDSFAKISQQYYMYDSRIVPLAIDLEILYADKGPDPGEDIRFRDGVWFESSPNGYLLRKMALQGSAPNSRSIVGANIIRIPEMYYIMAEALLETNRDLATEYFDSVIESRGMVGIADRPQGENTLTAEHIYLERRKEFYGEGMQWFNMKRLRRNIVHTPIGEILDGSKDETYTIPIPPSIEMELREK